jgi:hypothetical protein
MTRHLLLFAFLLGACFDPSTTGSSASALGDEETGMPDDGAPRRKSGVYRTPRPQGGSPVVAPMSITGPQLAAQLDSSGVLSAFGVTAQIDYSHPGIASAGVPAIAALTEQAVTVTTNTSLLLAGTTPSYEFRLDRERGVLSLNHRTRNFTDGNPTDVGAAAITGIAVQDLALFGLQPSTGTLLDVRALERTRIGDPDDVHKLAYKVHVRLAPKGLPVAGPAAVFSYYLDGTLHKVVIGWPAIDTNPAQITGPLTGSSVAAAAMAKLTGHPLGSITTARTLAAGLVVYGATLRRALFVSGKLANPGGDPRRGELIVPL